MSDNVQATFVNRWRWATNQSVTHSQGGSTQTQMWNGHTHSESTQPNSRIFVAAIQWVSGSSISGSWHLKGSYYELRNAIYITIGRHRRNPFASWNRQSHRQQVFRYCMFFSCVQFVIAIWRGTGKVFIESQHTELKEREVEIFSWRFRWERLQKSKVQNLTSDP